MPSDTSGTWWNGFYIAGLDPALHDQRSDDIDAYFFPWYDIAEMYEMEAEETRAEEQSDCSQSSSGREA